MGMPRGSMHVVAFPHASKTTKSLASNTEDIGEVKEGIGQRSIGALFSFVLFHASVFCSSLLNLLRKSKVESDAQCNSNSAFPLPAKCHKVPLPQGIIHHLCHRLCIRLRQPESLTS